MTLWGEITISQHIFLLDDDRDELEKLKTIIELELPLRTFPIANADLAMEFIKDHYDRFAAYVLDIEMVGQKYSGIQVAEEIRRQPGGAIVPIIFLTSHTHFGSGGLRHIHYYDFIQKPYEPSKVVDLLRNALSIEKSRDEAPPLNILRIEGRRLFFELDISNISCIEVNRSTILVTDFMGKIESFPVKPNTFTSICTVLRERSGHSLRQIHRSVIINVDRIKKIEWQKNTATIWLFNVKECKPVGKTYLKDLAIYNK